MDDSPSVRELVERAVPLRSGEAPGWPDVLRRATVEPSRRSRGRLPRRRRLVFVIGGIALLAAAVPAAVAVHATIVDFFASENAPESVVRSFASMEKGAPVMRPGVIAGETRKILEVPAPGRRATVLYVAPTVSGGFCWTIADPDSGLSSGGCGRRTGGKMHAGIPFAQDLRDGRVYGVYAAVAGRVRDHAITRIELRHSDGHAVDVPVAWVSEPIGVGFFVHPIPPQRWVTGKPVEVVGFASDGRVIRRERLELEIAPP